MTFDHSNRVGVLLSNLGTPDAPTRSAVRKFLKEFLWGRGVVDVPRVLWWFVLNGIVLNTRPAKIARLYQKIWLKDGSPLMVYTMRLAGALKQGLSSKGIDVELGMRYGKPSLESALKRLQDQGCDRILVLPLYPQYSSATTGSTFDEISRLVQKSRKRPRLRFVDHYYDHALFVSALAEKIKGFWRVHGEPEKLIFSFHGLPEYFVGEGDPYSCQCEKTAQHTAEKLGLIPEQWTLCYQSRFGRDKWLKPNLCEVLKTLPQRGAKKTHVVCPGFAVDGLETLEEVAIRNRELFLAAGGKEYEYIPALNDDPAHITVLADLVVGHATGWG